MGAAFCRKARYKSGAVAVFATARKLAILVYRMLRYGGDYTDIGETQYVAQFTRRRLAGLKDATKALGFELVPESAAG